MPSRRRHMQACWLVMMVSCNGDEFEAAPPATPPASLAGTYKLQLVNAQNSCFEKWTEGESTADVPLTVKQTDAALVGEIGASGASLVLGLLLGTATFTGQVEGQSLTLEALGDRRKQNTCEVQWRVALAGQTTATGFDGTLTYQPRIDVPDNPDCAPLPGCSSVQKVSALRTSP